MRSLPAFIASRLLSVAAVVLAVAVATFLMLHLLRPEAWEGDPRPLVVQLADYLRDVFLHWDFGRSWDTQQPVAVADLVNRGLPADVSLLVGGLVVGTLAGLAGGAVCATRRGSLAARVLEALAAFFLCAPVYWVGLMLVLTFGAGFGLVPIPFFETNVYEHPWVDPMAWLQALAVPWLVLGAPLAAVVLFTLVGVQMATLVTNMVLVEHAFSVPGLFQDLTEAMQDGNFPLLQAMTIVTAALIVVANLVVDVLHACLDPRVRVAG